MAPLIDLASRHIVAPRDARQRLSVHSHSGDDLELLRVAPPTTPFPAQYLHHRPSLWLRTSITTSLWTSLTRSHHSKAGGLNRSVTTFKAFWDEEVAAAEGRLDVENIWVATGLLLPVWNRLPQDDVRVWRIDNGAGTSILGRIIRPGAVEKLQAAFGLEQGIRLGARDLLTAVKAGDDVAIPGLGKARLASVLVNSARRLEIRDYDTGDRAWLKARGVFSEIIQYRTRLFVPVDRAVEILDAIIAERR